MTSNINFPILEHLELQNYGLFPGKDGEGGLDHSFLSGVTVAVGINGLGKTTLLNIVLRLLIGPFNPRKADILRPGSGKHELVKERISYFKDRVPDSAAHATATGVFRFGKKKLRVCRALNDLKVTELAIDEQEIENPTENHYKDIVCEFTGLTTDYDFHFLVRHLIFFMEERAPLIWYDKGQFEILRILFFDRSSSQQCADLADKATAADSQYRNLLWHYNSESKKLKNELRKVADRPELERDYVALSTMLNSVVQRENELEEQYNKITKRTDKLERELFRVNMDLEEIRQAIRAKEGEYFAQLFPDAPQSMQLVISAYLSSDGCLVCGSTENGAGRQTISKMRKGVCPLCDTPPERQERSGAKPIAKKQIEKLHKDFERKTKASEAKQRDLEDLNSVADLTGGEFNQARRERIGIENKMRILRPQLPIEDSELRDSEDRLEQLKSDVDKKRQTARRIANRYRDVTESASQQIGKVASKVQESFQEYSKEFLAEECYLQYEMTEQKVGQGNATVLLPSFTLHMTSGAMDAPTERQDSDQVSESQKEFVDLAFRMALMRDATQKSQGRMLIVETPESSLDGIFVERAGSMLREFAEPESRNQKNMLLASCNLNAEYMIPSLLGNITGRGRRKKMNAHIINLLEIAAPSRAYLEYEDQYNNEFETIFE